MFSLVNSKSDGLYYMKKTRHMDYSVQMCLHKKKGEEAWLFYPPLTWEPVCVSS